MQSLTRYLLLSLTVFTSFTCWAKIFEISDSLSIEKIAEQVYLHTSYQQIEGYGLVPANGIVMINDKQEAYIIDTPWNDQDTKHLVHWLEAKNIKVKASISRHFHLDTAGGIGYLNQHGIATYAGEKTNQLLTKYQKARAQHSLADKNNYLAAGEIEVFYAGAAHSHDNVVIWLAKQQLLFAGCLAKSLTSKGLGNTADANLQQWPNTISTIKQRFPNIKLLVPGHGKVGDVQLLNHTLALLEQAAKQ